VGVLGFEGEGIGQCGLLGVWGLGVGCRLEVGLEFARDIRVCFGGVSEAMVVVEVVVEGDELVLLVAGEGVVEGVLLDEAGAEAAEGAVA